MAYMAYMTYIIQYRQRNRETDRQTDTVDRRDTTGRLETSSTTTGTNNKFMRVSTHGDAHVPTGR